MMNNEATVDPWIANDPEESTQVEVNAIPNRGLQLEAASLAMLRSKGESVVNDFQETMGRSPMDSVRLIKAKSDEIQDKMQQAYQNALTPILSDVNTPFEQKEAALNAVRDGAVKQPDVMDSLATESLVQPSEGESHQGEQVRMTLAEQLSEVNQQRRELQLIANSVTGKNSQGTQKVLEVLEMFLPGEASITAGKLALNLKNGDSAAAAFLLPGSARKNLADSLENMPFEKRKELAKQLAAVMQESSGVLLDSNQLQMNQWVNDVVMGHVTDTDEWVDNIFGVLDLVGIGWTLRSARNLGKLSKVRGAFSKEVGAKNAERVEPYIGDAQATARSTIPDDVVLNGEAKVSTPTQPVAGRKIEDLEQELADNLADSSNQLERGAVAQLNAEREALLKSLKSGGLSQAELRKPGAANQALERRQNIQAQIQRIDDQLSSNAAASQAAERVKGLEDQLNALRKDNTQESATLNYVVDAIRREEMNSVYGSIAPRSPYTVLMSTNPNQARNLHASAVLGASDDIAQAITGASRSEVAMKAVMPQVASPNGVVTKVADDMESVLRTVFKDEFGQIIKNSTGGIAFTANEIEKARAARVRDYRTVAGMKINDAMTTVGGDGSTLKFSAVYSNGESGWLNASDAVAQAKESLRKQGVTDADIQVMKAVGSELHPVKLDDVKDVKGEYFVKIDMNDELRAHDVEAGDWDALDVKRNIFDFLETKGNNTWGSINRNVLTPDTTLHPTIVNGFSVADDKSAKLSSHFTEVFETNFSAPYMQLKKERRKAVDAYLKEANLKELKFDRTALLNQFSPEEVEVIAGWRKAWDNMWVYENLDLVRSLNKDGFMLFDHPNLRAVVRENEGAKKRFDRRVAYDPSTDSVRKLTDDEINEIYAKGGNVGDFRRPVNIAGADVEHIIIRNQGSEIARKVRETDKMLEYRDGYYQVFYKNPQFIEEIGADGKKTTIGVTGSTAEAERISKQLQAQYPGKTYTHRGDERGISRNSDVYWDMQHVGGRLAQRHRGTLLESSVGVKQMGTLDMIETPADSAVRAAHSIGGRMAMRETLDIAKTRYLEQFKKLLRTEDGIVQFPASRDQIFKEGIESSKELADARTTWEHIRYMENGYVNAMDATIKNALNTMARYAGMNGFDTTEKLLRAGADVNITGTVKGGVFASMLATNPLRQWIVQPQQALRMLAYNPSGFISGRAPKLIMEVLNNKMVGSVKPNHHKLGADAQEFYDWFRQTGMEQAITRGNLIRGTLLEAADRSNGYTRTKDAIIGNARKVGYDFGESLNLLIHSAYVFEKYKAAGKNIKDARIQEEMHAVTRGVTLNMNFAGDMPYNQNWAALLMTYMQVPHKFLISPLNRQIPVADRAKLLAADLTFWGLPVAAVYEMLDKDLPVENQWMREFLADGLLSVTLNGMFSYITGERQSTDYSSLSPFDMGSWYRHGENLMFDGGASGLISNTPTARVFGLGADSRLGMALKTTAGFFADIADMDLDSIPPSDAIDVANAWLGMSSGWTNLQKAKAAWFLGEIRDKHGRLTDDHVTKLEAAIQAFGFGPQDVRKFYETQQLGKGKGGVKSNPEMEDMKQFNMMVVQHVNGNVTSEKAIKLFANMIASKGWRPDKMDQKEQLYKLQQAWNVTADQKVKQTLFEQIIQMPSVDSTIDPIRNAPLTQADREAFEQVYRSYRQQIETYQKLSEEELKRKK